MTKIIFDTSDKSYKEGNWFANEIFKIKVFCASFFLVAQSFNLLNCSCHTLVLHMKICTPRYSSRHSFCLYNCYCIYYYNSLHKHPQNNLQHNVNGKLIWVLIEPNFYIQQDTIVTVLSIRPN